MALKIIGYILIAGACFELLRIIREYTTGKMEFWPFGAELGAGLIIWLGIFLIKRGNNSKTKI